MQAVSAAAAAEEDVVVDVEVEVDVDTEGVLDEVTADVDAEVAVLGALDEALVPLLLDPQALSAKAATPTRAAACRDFFT
jgi:hypothetical protein